MSAQRMRRVETSVKFSHGVLPYHSSLTNVQLERNFTQACVRSSLMADVVTVLVVHGSSSFFNLESTESMCEDMRYRSWFRTTATASA
ncbi:hypothetical protein A0H81_00739 [Grifola frondosa]|uniref:Uncharacterized protein n=1 Tax=Grifola frondosa TaxID=5627 RepID=A0A1C7MQH9_GRIFR|nr:hypothetical protein A0H81_00739 [Grifola frondosa]